MNDLVAIDAKRRCHRSNLATLEAQEKEANDEVICSGTSQPITDHERGTNYNARLDPIFIG